MQSKKEADADASLERVQVIYDKLPKFIKDFAPLVQGRKTFCSMKNKSNRSHIMAIPAGADHARQYTASGYFSDEFCFQEEVENVMAALVPTLGKQGWFAGVSSAQASYGELLIFDKR